MIEMGHLRSRRRAVEALSAVFVFAALLSAAPARAQQPGDIYAVSAGTRAVVRVDPATGAQSLVAPGSLSTTGGFAVGVAVAGSGDLYLTLGEKIARIVPSGTQSDLATGFGNPGGITLEPTGDILVADLLTNAISRVNPATGTSSILSSGGQISGPLGIGRAPNGDILVASRNNSRIVRIHPTTGAQTIVSEAGLLGNPQWLAVSLAGDIFVTTGNGIVKVNPGTGAQSVLASGGVLFSPRGIALDASGGLVVANGNNRILRVNVTTGAVTEISPRGGSEFINGTAGVAIVMPPPASDTTPPTLVLPAPITVLAQGPTGSVVTYSATATDNADPAPVVACSPASGTTFPIGVTTVGCTATDATGNQSAGSFTVSVTVTSASVTMKGTRLRANGASQLLFSITGPSPHANQNGDVTFALVPGIYTIATFNSQPYGTFTVDSFGQVVSPTGSLTVAGTVVDFNLALLAGVAIPVSHLSSNPATGFPVLAIAGISSLVQGTTPTYYLPPTLTGVSQKVGLRAEQHTFGTFRVKPDLTLEDTELTDALILVNDGTGPGGGPRLDFDLSRLYPFAFPYAMTAFTTGTVRIVDVAIGNVASFFGPATVYLPASGGTTSLQRNYVMSTRGGSGVFGTFVVGPDLTPQQATGAMRFDGGNNFYLDFNSLVPITLNVRQLADPFLSLSMAIWEAANFGEGSVYLPPSNTNPNTYDVNSAFGTTFGRFTIAPDLTVHTTGALSLGADGHTIGFDTCALDALRITPAVGRQWRAATSSSGGVYAGYSPVATTLFLPNGTYGIFFTDLSSITVTLTGGVITAANPGTSVSGGSVSIGACDNAAPVLSLPADFTVSATSTAGAMVSYTATATDAIDPTPTLTCTPASGSHLTLGAHAVACTATDHAGNSASGTFNVTVADQTPPVLTLPGPITVEATGSLGAVVAFSATATDAIDVEPSIACTPAPGAMFTLGTTAVSCSAVDLGGNVTTGSFNVVVRDTTAPALTVPSPITVPSTSALGAVVSYGVTAIDVVDPAPVVSCVPPPGATFSIGLTTVICTAADASGNLSTRNFTVGVTVTSASVTIKGTRLRANGASQLLFRIAGPSPHLNQTGDVTFALVPGTYTIDAFNSQPYGAFTLDSFGQVVSPTGSLTIAGNVIDFDLSQLAGVAIPVSHLSSNFAAGSSVLAIPGISSLISAANPIYYLPSNLPGASYELNHRGSQGPFGRFRVRPDLTLEDLDLTDALILTEDGTGPGGGPRLDFDLGRLYPFTFPYAMTDFGDPDTAGYLASVGISNVGGFTGPATIYLPPNVGTTKYVLATRTGSGIYGSFVVAPDLSPQQATGAIRFDASNHFFLDYAALLPVTIRFRQVADPYPGLYLGILNDANIGDNFTVYLPPSNPPNIYTVGTILSTTFGTFTISPSLTLQTTGALRVGADGRTIDFDTCALNALRVTPGAGLQWRAGPPSAVSGFYSYYSSVPTTLFLPDGTYGIYFTNGSSLSVTVAGGAIMAATPGLSVSGGSVSLGTCDNAAPVLSLPANFTVAATTAAGAIVNYVATATDAVDPTPTLVCAPPSGSLFSLGAHTVACTATDDTGNSASGSFHLTVGDQTPPALSVPGPITVEAVSAAGAVVTYAATATDGIDPTPGVSCSPASGSTFPLGITTVTCSASDASGNASLAAFSVTVVDTTAPALTVPSDITVETGNPAGLAVSFSVTATDAVDPAPLATCAPASGATFPVGTTPVACSAGDASGNARTGGFAVNVVLCPTPTVVLDPGNLLPAYTNQATRTVPGSILGGSCIANVELIVTGSGGTQAVPVAFGGDGAVSGEITLLAGSNDVVLKVTDRVGRTFASGARTLVLDEIAPQLQVLSPSEDSATGSAALSLSFSIADSSPTSVSVAGQTFTFTSASNVQSATVTLGHDGPQTIDLVASDAAGNASAAHLTVLLDLTAPLASIDLVDGVRFGPLLGDVLPFTLMVDALSATTVTTSYGTTHALPRGGGIIHGVVPLVEGVSTATFTIVNEIGRVTTLSRTMTYDKTPPEGGITSPGPGDFVRGTLHLSADVTDALTGVAGVTFQVDGLPAQAGTAGTGDAWIASFNSTTVSDGPHSVQAVFADGVANARSASRSFVVDNTSPAVSLGSPASGSYVHGVVNIVATATDVTSGVSGLSIAVNGTSVGTCPNSPCSVAFDTSALGSDGAFTIVATARDGAGNTSIPAQVTAIADNSAPSNFLVSPTNGQVLTTSMLVSVNVVDSAFARVECFVDGVSLGVSTNPRFSQTVSLLDRMDGTIQVACRAEDLAGNATLQTVVPTIRNWNLRMRPSQLNLKSRGKDVRMTVRNLDHSVSNASLLLSRLSTLFLVLPGGVAPIPVASARPPGDRDDDDDGDSDNDGDDEPRGRVLLKFSRSVFVAGIKSGMAIGAIDPKKPVVVTLVSGAHVIGTDTIRVKP